jgi:DNA repair protein RadC
MRPAELMARPGVGPAKAAAVCAAMELGRRMASSELRSAERLEDPDAAGGYLARLLRHERQEVFGCLCLDGRHRLLRRHELTRGTRTQAPVDPGEVYRRALLDHAAGLLVFHNHPSGDPAPSVDDLELTRRLANAGETVGIRLLDHLVVAGNRWLSLRRVRPEVFRGG